MPVYGDGLHVRDWLYVEDHCRAILVVLEKGMSGQTYNIGGHNEKTNLEIVHTICDLLDIQQPLADGKTYREQIVFVKDRLGHDRRYAIDASKIKKSWRGYQQNPLTVVFKRPLHGILAIVSGADACLMAAIGKASLFNFL